MPGVDIGRKRWTNTMAPINRSHPSSVGLHALVIADGTSQIVEKVRGLTPDSVVPTSTRSVTSVGYAATFPNSTTVGGAVWSFDRVSNVTPPFTIHCVYTPSTLTNTTIVSGGGSSSTGSGWRLGVDTTAAENLRYTHWGIADYDVTGILDAGLTIAITLTLPAAPGTVTIYKNAVQVSSQAVGNISETGMTDGMSIGCHRRNTGDTSGASNTPITMVGMWKRAMGPSEIAALYADPFCMLKG